jgi:hypothetical protein
LHREHYLQSLHYMVISMARQQTWLQSTSQGGTQMTIPWSSMKTSILWQAVTTGHTRPLEISHRIVLLDSCRAWNCRLVEVMASVTAGQIVDQG